MTRNSMKKLPALCSAITLIALFPSALCCGTPAKAENSIQPIAVAAQYAQINDAIIKHNLDKLMSFFTPDFIETNSTGAMVNRDQERKEYDSQLNKIKSMQIDYTVQNIADTPAGTMCDVKFHMTGVGFKRIMFMKIQGSFTNDLVVHDLWVATPQGLRLKSRLTILDDTRVAAS